MTARLAVLTSGGDAPGMNPVLRGIVRRALDRGADVFAVREGYDGLVNGWIEPAGWGLVSGIQQRGGTILGSSRSAAFRTVGGRRQAAQHLLDHGVTGLAVIGGDGSLTGAMALAAEWPSSQPLRIVGVTGSIDNDLCGTDSTVGGDSALHRIVSAVDALRATAGSHRRAFVVEVMGRRCGYLATAAAACTGADLALVPEDPPADWRQAVCDAIRRGRDHGQRHGIVLLAEGATDAEGHRIEVHQVVRAIEEGTGIETRPTVLGHVQRGGTPSAFDRITATALGVRAADVLLADTPRPPTLVGTEGHDVVLADLAQAIADTRAVHTHLDAKDEGAVLALRSPVQQRLHRLWHPVEAGPIRRLLVAHVGAPAPGMNAALHAIARAGAGAGIEVLGAVGGLGPFVRTGELRALDPYDLRAVLGEGSTVLGTDRSLPMTEALTKALDAHAIDAVVLVGGFETLSALGRVERPAVAVPATISDNVPGTDRSIGHDTALGTILDGLDRLRQSATGSGDRVFVVEVMGRRCGHLARRAAVGAGAELVYSHEDPPDLQRLTTDLRRLVRSFEAGRHLGLVVVADGVPAPFDAHTLARIFAAEGQDAFDTRVCVPGHLQQGGAPSPGDRLLAAQLGVQAVRHLASGVPGAWVVGQDGAELAATPLHEALALADQVHRRRAAAERGLQPDPFRE